MYERKIKKSTKKTTISRRKYVLQVVMNPEEKTLLEMASRRQGVSFSEFARRCILKGVGLTQVAQEQMA